MTIYSTPRRRMNETISIDVATLNDALKVSVHDQIDVKYLVLMRRCKTFFAKLGKGLDFDI